MCMMIYIASDHPLPLAAWDEARPGFHVAELRRRDEPVRRQFSMRCVYYVGSHEGCGCGFQYGQHEGLEEDPGRLAAAREARRQLSEYLAAALRDRPEVRLFACWDGDQGSEPAHRVRMQPADLLGDRVHFREKELIVVTAGPV
jgi:hypothetical protein